MSFCLHVSSSSSFLSLARTFVRTLVCTHTRTRTLLTTRFRWPRFVNYNEVWLIGCPSSLGSFSSATTHTFVCLVLLTFICPFCVHMCLPPFRAGWRSHMPPFGEACVCVCNPWNHRGPVGLFSLLSLCCTAGECGVIVGPHSTKLPQSRDTESDQLGVPASFLFLKWHEAKPRTSSCRHARNAVNLSSRRFVAFNYRNSGPLHLVFSGFGSLRPACRTAFSSVHNIVCQMMR